MDDEGETDDIDEYNWDEDDWPDYDDNDDGDGDKEHVTVDDIFDSDESDPEEVEEDDDEPGPITKRRNLLKNNLHSSIVLEYEYEKLCPIGSSN